MELKKFQINATPTIININNEKFEETFTFKNLKISSKNDIII